MFKINNFSCATNYKKMLHYPALFSVPIIWGSYAPLMKYGFGENIDFVSLFIFSSLSSCISFAIFICPFLWKMPLMTWKNIKECTLMGMCLFCGQIFQVAGLLQTDAVTHAILIQSSCVFVNCHEWYCKGGTRRIVLAVVAVFGGYLASVETHNETTTLGILYSIFSALFYALHTISVGDCEECTITQSAIQTAVLVMMNTFVVHVIIASNANLNTTKIHTQHSFWLLLWNSVFGTAWTTFAMSFAQTYINAGVSAIAYASEPVFTILICIFVFDKMITVAQMGAISLIVASNLLASHNEFIVAHRQETTKNSLSTA